MAKKIKLPFVQRATGNFIDNNTTRLPDPAPAFSGVGMESILPNGEIAASLVSRSEARKVLLVIDQRLSMYYGSKQKMKSVVAAEAAALVAWHAFAQKDRIGAIVFNDREVAMLPPHCSRVQVMLILHDLLNQNHRLSGNSEQKSNPAMLNQALRRVAATAQGNSQIILITDGSGQDHVTGQLLQNISVQNDLAVILVYDPRQVECADGARSNSSRRMSFRSKFNGSCLFADGTLTIPLNNQVDAVDQFRRGFRKLLRLRHYRNKQQVQSTQSDGHRAEQTRAIPERPTAGETPISPLPSSREIPQPLCVQLNSR